MDERERSSLDRVVEFYRRDLDLTLLRENLRRSPTERLLALQELQRFAEELHRAGEKARAELEALRAASEDESR